MLIEIKNARQIVGEGFRRWFTDADMDLIVWYNDSGQTEIVGFQLCFGKLKSQHALTWTATDGYTFNRIDEGESPYSSAMSPVLIAPAHQLDTKLMETAFSRESVMVPFDVKTLVLDSIRNYLPSA